MCSSDLELLEVMASRKNICNYVHFPMQSGSNEVLKRMNRTYTREHFYDMAMKIREIMPNCGLSKIGRASCRERVSTSV